ncbi:MAG: S24/S26 family peptidase [Bryobacteraceae bacterium]|jgi:hypothetical protein
MQTVQCDLCAEALRVSGRLFLRVFGGSMLPSVWPGDILVIDRAEIARIRPGDLVLCARPGGFMVHRAILNGRDALITRGDAHGADDPPVSPAQVLGRVVAIRRGRTRFTPRRTLSRTQKLLSFLIFRFARFKTLLLRLNALRLRFGRSQIGRETALA